MPPESLEAQFRSQLCDSVQLVREGEDRYRVLTPFQFTDGDHITITLKRYGNVWVLTDEGATYLHLALDLHDQEWLRGARRELITKALRNYDVSDRDGELVARVEDGAYADALYSFAQAVLSVADVTYLSKERIRNTFAEDIRE